MDYIMQRLRRIQDSFRAIAPKRRRLILGVVALLLVLAVGIAFLANRTEYRTLFTGLNDQESSEIIARLTERGVNYKYQQGGTILVDSAVEEQLRAELVYEGYPKSGFTYDVFKSNISLMTTDFEKVKYELFELQDRIGATIRLFDGVKDAKVTIALAEERRYVLDANQKTEAKASVVVLMQPNKELTPKQVSGIKNLVSKSIKDLNIENVTVLDGEGKELSSGDATTGDLSKLRTELEDEIERNIENKVVNVLAPFYGTQNIRVSVKATLDINKRIRETINYNFPEWTSRTTERDEAGNPTVTEEKTNVRGIPSRESINQEFVRDGETAVGGVAGTESNADISIYGSPALEAQGNESYIINQNDIEYLVNQIKEQVQIDTGVLEDLRVSVSLNNAEVPGLARDQVIDLVGNAAGIAKERYEEKVTVVTGVFYNPDAPTEQTEELTLMQQYRVWILGGIIALVLAVLITIIVFILLRRRKKKKVAQMGGAAQTAEFWPRGSDEPKVSLPQEQIIDIKNEETLQLRDKIRDFAGNNPEISAQLIKSWLRGEGGDE